MQYIDDIVDIEDSYDTLTLSFRNEEEEKLSNLIEKERKMENRVIEVFGKWAVEIDGKVELFTSEGDASTALAIWENEAEFTNRAAAYCKANNITGKNMKGKINIIGSFLAWEAAGCPKVEIEAPEESDTVEAETADEEEFDFA